MQDREVSVWRVVSGSHSRWFSGEVSAREWAGDRYEVEFDGIPFVEQVTLTEAINRLNQFESSK